ncbi:MAG: tetratricopeptide repeat protein [Dongiaceae bacterium]
MLIRPKRHWATLLAVGLPLIVGGCAGSGMPTPKDSASPAASAAGAVDALTLADRLKFEGNLSSAASMYQQAHHANPGDIRPLMGLAECLLGMGANVEAAQAYASALAIQPNNLDALRGIGHTRILLGQPQFAVEQYQTALRIAPKDVRTLNGLGVAQDMVGDHVAAQQSYKQVLAIEPNNASAKNNLALSLALSGDNASAIKLLEDLNKSAGSTAVNRQNLALVYGVSGQLEQAEQVSRADLPEDAVNRNIAAMSANADSATRQELLKRSLGVELKGLQYTPAAKPLMPLTNLAQAASDDRPVYLSGSDGSAMPIITTGKSGQIATAPSIKSDVRIKGSTGDAWSDDWDEELVDAADIVGGGEQPAVQSTAPAPLVPPAPEKPATSPFLSASNALAADAPSNTDAATATPAASETAPPAQEAPTAAVSIPAPAGEMPAALPETTTTPPSQPAQVAKAPEGATDAAPTVTTTTIATAKIYTVQLASYRSEVEATAGWQTLTTEQADLLAKLPHSVAKADLGADKGIYYRLQAGAFSDRTDAKALCSDLQTRAIDCMVVEAAAAGPQAQTRQSLLATDRSFVIGAR